MFYLKYYFIRAARLFPRRATENTIFVFLSKIVKILAGTNYFSFIFLG